jgi:glycosyltransferase 2 family protein
VNRGQARTAQGQATPAPGAPGETDPDHPTGQVPADASPASDPELRELAELPVDDLVDQAGQGTLDAPSANRRPWVLPLRIGLSLVMLVVVFTQIPDFDWNRLVPTWSAESTLWLAGAAALTLLGIVLSALRWHQVLHALGLRARMRRLVPLYFAGQFVSNVLPTTIGGDVLRVARLSKENGDTPDTFASVVLERLTGWLVLPLITFFGLAINPGLRELGYATGLAVSIAAATLLGLALLLFMADHPKLGGRFRSSEGWRRFVGAVHLGVDRLRRRPRAALGVLAAGLLYQFVLCLAALMAAEALGLTALGLTPLLAFFPAVLIAQVLPIGISGLGVREGAFVIFLTPLGVPAEQAVALGLLLYLLNLGVSLLGAPAFAVGGRTRPAVP